MSLLNECLWSFGTQSIIFQPLTLVWRSLYCLPKNAADSLWTDDKVLQRRVQSRGLLSWHNSRCLSVCPPFSAASSPRSPSLTGQGPAAATGPGLKSVTSDQAITPGWLTTPVRKNYLRHEWTCLFIEMALWRMVFVAPKPALYFKIILHFPNNMECVGCHFCAIFIQNTVKFVSLFWLSPL